MQRMFYLIISIATIFILLIVGYSNCSGGFQNGLTSSLVSSQSIKIPIVISGKPYFNAPTVSVELCTPGTNKCKMVDNILLDTGSHGLRVFSSLLTSIQPEPILANGNQLAECYEYYDGTYGDWGPVKRIDVRLGDHLARSVPVQMIESTFSTIPSTCLGPDTDPTQLGFNGILGVGTMAADCGTPCATSTANQKYYSCSATTCTATTVPVANQVTNPVALMPIDNNGLVVKLPDISASGSKELTGELILGIGSRPDNSGAGVTVLPTDQYGYFKSNINGSTTNYDAQAFDTGTATNSLPVNIGIPKCQNPSLPNYLCPTSLQTVAVKNMGFNLTPIRQDAIQIANAETSYNSSFLNFKTITDVNVVNVVLWGTPFFYGRSIYIGLEGKNTPLGRGPFWAY